LRCASAGEDASLGLIVKGHGPPELRGPDARVDLGRVDSGVAEHGAHFLKIVPLFEHLDRYAVPQVMRPVVPCDSST
jgi:hypothetical protein